MRKISVKNKKGITLLEVVISIAILSIIIVPISMMINTSVKTNKNSESKQQATVIAQKLIEDLKVKNKSVGDTIGLLDGSITLNKMVIPDTGHDIGYKATNLDVGQGFIADVSFQRRETYKGNTAGTLTDSDFDAIIEMINSSSFKLTSKDIYGTPYEQYSYSLANSLYIKEVSDSIIELYDYKTINEKSLIVSLQNMAGKNGKVKIVYETGMVSSDIRVSSYNTTDSDAGKALTIYCYKNNSETVSNTVSNIGGYVNIYDNLKAINVPTSDTRGIYDVNVGLYKIDNGTKKKVYDVKSSVNLMN